MDNIILVGSMSLTCPNCRIGFGFLNTNKQARVLSCGDTYCCRCISNEFMRSNEFPCIKCGAIITRQANLLPPNKLYYESQLAFKQHLARLDWQHPPQYKKPAEVQRFNVDYQSKCMNPFCMRLKYRKQSVSELFCSKQCKMQHEQLYMK